MGKGKDLQIALSQFAVEGLLTVAVVLGVVWAGYVLIGWICLLSIPVISTLVWVVLKPVNNPLTLSIRYRTPPYYLPRRAARLFQLLVLVLAGETVIAAAIIAVMVIVTIIAIVADRPLPMVDPETDRQNELDVDK